MIPVRQLKSEHVREKDRILDNAQCSFSQGPHRVSLLRNACRHAPPPTLYPFTFTSIRTQTAVKWNTLLGIFAPGGRFILTKVTGTLASPLGQITLTLDARG